MYKIFLFGNTKIWQGGLRDCKLEQQKLQMLQRILLSAKVHDWDNGVRTCMLSHPAGMAGAQQGLAKPTGQVSYKYICLEPLLWFKAARVVSVHDSWFLFRTAHHGKETGNVHDFNFHSLSKVQLLWTPNCSFSFLNCLLFSCISMKSWNTLGTSSLLSLSPSAYSAKGQEVGTHCKEVVDGFEIFMPLSAISMANFISIFLYNDTRLDLGWCSRIKIFFKYLLSNFLNLQKRYQNQSIEKEICFHFCTTSWSSFKCIYLQFSGGNSIQIRGTCGLLKAWWAETFRGIFGIVYWSTEIAELARQKKETSCNQSEKEGCVYVCILHCHICQKRIRPVSMLLYKCCIIEGHNSSSCSYCNPGLFSQPPMRL